MMRQLSTIAAGMSLAVLAGAASSPDKYTVKIPDGLALAEVKGYESWEVVSASHPVGGPERTGICHRNPW